MLSVYFDIPLYSDIGTMKLFFKYFVICAFSSSISAVLSDQSTNFVWTKDKPVAKTLGAEDAIYCRITGPDGFAYHESFGKCRLFIDRALPKHEGVWTMQVGLPGRVVTDDSTFNVKVVKAEPKPVVETQVIVNKPTVSLSCSVSSPSAVSITSCAFLHTSGRILLANEGVEEERFSFYSDDSNNSDADAHQCGLLITNPLVQDLGLWRCAIDTEGDVYYGFLTVYYPGVTRDPEEAAAIITEPILRASRDTITDVSGNSVSMSCSIHSAIRYCYFRSPNGTVFNIRPGVPHSEATYVGAGFDAGECGIRFRTLTATDSGDWSCHIGLMNQTVLEQRAVINVTIHHPMTVNQRMEGSQLIIETQVYNNRLLDYCRFVRIDGFGFSIKNFPNNYTNLSSLSQGKCGIAMDRPSPVDRHPWTIVAKIQGQDKEISVVTQIACGGQGIITFLLPSAWVIVMVLIVTILLVSALIGPKNNREWASRRASAIRNSFRRKTVVQNNDETTQKNVTASAA